ncbi:hypothetical protein [Enterobacter hormaechei]|uniref:hypothetical protein n=1 Tax=Enterobacter hormaechei TaxID=158836 RepID=UPI00242F9B90|nr:hypothetical protein [Enterobacter hormaechei]HEO8956303.1 hypothetical protein [Enterobacter hormaechei subsp. steigerwaltii]MEA5200600.1 hypothetical protein [Enterobacter hormaechei]WGA69607.1 hypothetical protein NFL05_16485 [Enterobacter hormaechei]WGA74093.1 hypothetical protein NFL06_16490 [Enterobacter hormaechei]HEO8959710.1 hypothetical protein [Enterobacter hormaechei subsp. steigerwaltii]
MKERGMIFNGEMVRAILDGRKTQTRRIMKVQPKPCNHTNWPDYSPESQWKSYPNGWCCAVCANGTTIDHRHHAKGITCPYGTVGDRIWVRETFSPVPDHEEPAGCSALLYAADGNGPYGKWVPSIHMPRWASRLTLEITGVRVERLRDLSEDDAKSEGITPPSGGVLPGWEYRINFRDLWVSIYGSDNWEANPWVWVIEFKRIEGGTA